MKNKDRGRKRTTNLAAQADLGTGQDVDQRLEVVALHLATAEGLWDPRADRAEGSVSKEENH